MKHPFVYTIQGYNHTDTEDFYLENGVGFCESFADAANILEKRYGNDLISIKHLELYEDSTVITLSKSTFDEVVDCLESSECFEIKCDSRGKEIQGISMLDL